MNFYTDYRTKKTWVSIRSIT